MWRIFLSPIFVIIVIALLPSIEKGLFFLPLLFSLSVSLFNLNKIKINQTIGVIFSILQNYLVFMGLAIIIHYFDEWLIDISSGEVTEFEGVIIITSGGYLAALLLFYFKTYLFNVNSLKFSYQTITFCYAFIVLVMSIFSKNEYLQLGVEKFPSFLISWCIFMSLAYSISLNQETFIAFSKRILNKKNESTS